MAPSALAFWSCPGRARDTSAPRASLPPTSPLPSLSSASLLFLSIRPAAPAHARARLAAACSPFHPQPYRSISLLFRSLLCLPCPWTGHHGHPPPSPARVWGSGRPPLPDPLCPTTSPEHAAPRSPGSPDPTPLHPSPRQLPGRPGQARPGKIPSLPAGFAQNPPARRRALPQPGYVARPVCHAPPGAAPVSPGDALGEGRTMVPRRPRGRAALPEPLSPRGTRRGSGACAGPPGRCAGSPGSGARSSARPPQSAATP